MKKPLVLNNELLARPFPHHKTGYKDPRNNCNRTDRRNGGEFSTYESLYQASHAHVSNMPVKFRQDGIPISARRVDGMPLMSPKLPSRADLTAGRALSKKYSTTKIQLGNPHVKDPKHYKTVSELIDAVRLHIASRNSIAKVNREFSYTGADTAAGAGNNCILHNMFYLVDDYS